MREALTDRPAHLNQSAARLIAFSPRRQHRAARVRRHDWLVSPRFARLISTVDSSPYSPFFGAALTSSAPALLHHLRNPRQAPRVLRPELLQDLICSELGVALPNRTYPDSCGGIFVNGPPDHSMYWSALGSCLAKLSQQLDCPVIAERAFERCDGLHLPCREFWVLP